MFHVMTCQDREMEKNALKLYNSATYDAANERFKQIEAERDAVSIDAAGYADTSLPIQNERNQLVLLFAVVNYTS